MDFMWAGNMNEDASSSSFPQKIAEIIDESKVTFYSNGFHLEPESYKYYQQPDLGSIQQPLKKLSDWQCLQATENPMKRIKDGGDQKAVKNKKLAHHERMQEIGRIRERVPMRRSQKLADKITALQKLVSPYGKTDTASVLEEAHIEINLLHNQIEELLQKTQTSANNVGPVQYRNEEAEIGLRDRGLCLVPISTPQINNICFGKQKFLPRHY